LIVSLLKEKDAFRYKGKTTPYTLF